MKHVLAYIMFLLIVDVTQAQQTYTIQADSVKITNCDSAELILENHTQGIKGFLYNRGNGRTEFRKGMIRLNDSTYVFGGDTLRYNAWMQGGNTWGKTGILGTLDNNHLDLYSGGLQRGRLTNTGNFLFGTSSDNGSRFQVNGTSYFSDVVSIANYKQLNVGGINIVDNPTGRYITSIASQSLTMTSGAGGYAVFNKAVKLGSDTTIIFSPGGAVNNAVTLSSVTGQPSSTTMSFGNLRNDAAKRAVINTTDFDATAQGGTTAIDLYMYPGKEIYSGSQGNTIMGYDGTNQRGNLMIGGATNNGSKLQVTGSSYFNGGMQITGTGGGINNYVHSQYNPTLNSSANAWDYLSGMTFRPTMNINNDYQSIYPVSIMPTFNILSGKVQHTDNISPALYVSSTLGGIRIDQNASYAGNTGQPLFVYQGGTSDKESLLLYRNGNNTVRPIIWCNDNRPAATKANIIPMLRNTISNPTTGGGVSWIMDRYYYGTEASIDMHYETTPDSTAHVNTSIAFYTMVNRAWTNPMYINGANIGLGTKVPTAQLHTTGSVRMAGLTNDNTQTRVVVSDASGNLYYRTLSTWAADEAVRSSLAVNGPIKAKSLTLNASAAAWPDFVFDSAYALSTLQEVAKYIKMHHHLPGLASAPEVERVGVDVGAHQAILLKKIEELTLYAIGQDERLKGQDEQLKELGDRLKTQGEMVRALQLQNEELADLKKEILALKKMLKK